MRIGMGFNDSKLFENLTPSVKAGTLIVGSTCTNRSNYLLFTKFSGGRFNNQIICIRNAVFRAWQENRWLVVSRGLTSHMDDWLDLKLTKTCCIVDKIKSGNHNDIMAINEKRVRTIQLVV